MARLEDYELGRPLAKGGMGVVHEAVERASGRRVAIKRILPHVLDPDAVGRFILEGRAVARLDHPGIVAVHAAGEAGGAPFLVMDLVDGESLLQRLLRDGPLPPAEACRLAAEVARALAHAHARGVLHRDVKPANILVDSTGAPRLIDFGLAKLAAGAGSLDHLTRTGELVGTPAFMAPEQANGRAVDARTDVYGLGATLFTLLTDRPPFDGPNALAVLEGVLTRRAAAPSACGARVSAALDRLVLDCLAKAPAARPASMAELAARLDACAAAPSPAGRGLLAALAALTLVALVTAGAALSRGEVAGGAGSAAQPASATPLAPVASPAAASRARVRTRGWPDRALTRWRRPDLELRLAPPPAGAPADVCLERARALRRAGRLREAQELLARPALDLEDRDVVLLRFQVAFELDPSSADPALLDRAIAQDPGWAEGLFVREVHRLRSSTAFDVERLRRAFDRLRELRREDLRICLEAERLLLSHPGRERLRSLLTELERAPPTDTVCLVRADLCVLHVALLGPDRLVQLERVASDLEPVVERAPLLASAVDLRWRLRQLRGDVRGAVEGIRDVVALKTRPEDQVPLITMAAHFLAAEGQAGAAEALAWLPSEPTDDGPTEYLRGALLQTLGRDDEAKAVFQGVLDDGLVGPPSLYLSCSGRTGDRPWTARYLAQLERDHPSSPDVWHEAAQLLFGQGEAATALAACDHALELGSGRRGRHQRALLLQRLGRSADALAELDALVAGEPRDRWALAQRAVARAAAGDPRAVADAERAASLPRAPDLDPSTVEDARPFQAELALLEKLLPAARVVDWQTEVALLLRKAELPRPLPSP